MSILQTMKQKGWLNENMAAILAFMTTVFAISVDTIVLLKNIKTTDSTTITILTSVHGAWMVVLGYYFVASKTKKDSEKQIGNEEIPKKDEIQS